MKVWSSLGIMCTWRGQCFCKSSSIAPSSLDNLHHGLHPAVGFGLLSLGNLLPELPVTAPALEEITLNSCTLMYCQAPYGTASSSPCAKVLFLQSKTLQHPRVGRRIVFPQFSQTFVLLRPHDLTARNGVWQRLHSCHSRSASSSFPIYLIRQRITVCGSQNVSTVARYPRLWHKPHPSMMTM
jgi:hypothetical protein